MTPETDVLLHVQNLVKHFPVHSDALFKRKKNVVHAVDGISFDLCPRRNAGAGGRVGLREIHHRAHHPAALPPDLRLGRL